MKGRENKPHIGIFGRCNTGKSTLLNFITGSRTAIVSPEAGTTADPVKRSHEILGLGPVIFIDTAGIDDTSSELGRKRTEASLEALGAVDMAIIVFRHWGEEEEALAARLDRDGIPFITVRNIFACRERISDDANATNVSSRTEPCADNNVINQEPDGRSTQRSVISLDIDAAHGGDRQRTAILEAIKRTLPESSYTPVSLFGDRVGPGDTVLLICPIDSSAPAGRLILPQVQAIRELLDKGAVAIVLQPDQIETFIANNPAPRLAVTDSQMFGQVERLIPQEVELTSFSILLAAAKGDYGAYLEGLAKVDSLRDGDRILIVENCSHQVSCDDIGRVKIPAWLDAYTGKRLEYTFAGGRSALPADLSKYALMVQCGGCMVTRRQLLNRIREARRAGVAVTNYGMLIRKIRG